MGLRRVGKSLGGSSFEIVWQDPNRFVLLCKIVTNVNSANILEHSAYKEYTTDSLFIQLACNMFCTYCTPKVMSCSADVDMHSHYFVYNT